MPSSFNQPSASGNLPVLSAATGTASTGFARAFRFRFEACDSDGVFNQFLVRVTGRSDCIFRMRIIPPFQVRKNLLIGKDVSQAANDSEQVIVTTEFLNGLTEFTPNVLVKLARAR